MQATIQEARKEYGTQLIKSSSSEIRWSAMSPFPFRLHTVSIVRRILVETKRLALFFFAAVSMLVGSWTIRVFDWRKRPHRRASLLRNQCFNVILVLKFTWTPYKRRCSATLRLDVATETNNGDTPLMAMDFDDFSSVSSKYVLVTLANFRSNQPFNK